VVGKLIPFLRISQSRVTARILIVLGRSSLGRSFVCNLRKVPLATAALNWGLGFRGTFASLAEAEAYVGHYLPTGHAHPGEHELQVAKAETTRESDYPVLFFLSRSPELRTVFDLGGGIGNLFYVLDRHLRFPKELVWTIQDLPIKKQPALSFAKLKSESRVAFTDDFSAASGVDLFIVVGALHFFEQPLSDLLCTLDKLPKHVIVNRTPFSHAQDIVTVQDYGDWVFPCKLHSVTKLVSGMQLLGYELIASWPVYERKLNVPLYPEYAEPYYGFYFRLRCDAVPNTQLGSARDD
jgi:putative methyltransferase (TIGR04325 family)